MKYGENNGNEIEENVKQTTTTTAHTHTIHTNKQKCHMNVCINLSLDKITKIKLSFHFLPLLRLVLLLFSFFYFYSRFCFLSFAFCRREMYRNKTIRNAIDYFSIAHSFSQRAIQRNSQNSRVKTAKGSFGNSSIGIQLSPIRKLYGTRLELKID